MMMQGPQLQVSLLLPMDLGCILQCFVLSPFLRTQLRIPPYKAFSLMETKLGIFCSFISPTNYFSVLKVLEGLHFDFIILFQCSFHLMIFNQLPAVNHHPTNQLEQPLLLLASISLLKYLFILASTSYLKYMQLILLLIPVTAFDHNFSLYILMTSVIL